MTTTRLRPLGAVLLAILCAAVLTVSSMLTSAFVAGVEKVFASITLLDNPVPGWIMGGTGLPIPDTGYMNSVADLYMNLPANATLHGVPTPEQFCPIVCLPPPNPQLNFGDSLNEGVANLNDALSGGSYAGTVLGFSQSATVATIEMQNLADAGTTGDLHFVLLGNPNNPLGGILDRFQFPDSIITGQPQHVPFLNIPLSIGATPTDAFPTDIYTGMYDGWANFPRDPLNVLADINALIGIGTVHPYYPIPSPDNLQIDDIINLGTFGQTDFHMIPAPTPMLAWMFTGGTAGQFFYNFFNPWLSLVNNWGYGNPGDPGAVSDALQALNPGMATQDLIGPWQVNALGDPVLSGTAGFFLKMDPLQLLAGMQNATVQSIVGPFEALFGDNNDVLNGVTDVLNFLSGYDLVNWVDQFLLNGWTDILSGLDGLTGLDLLSLIGPDVIFDGGPLIPADPLIDLVGLGFDLFNVFGA